MSILIIDDDQDCCLLIQTFLEGAGYRDISIANSAEEAFPLLSIDAEGNYIDEDSAVEPFDLIILDVVMPGQGGIETCRQIKQYPALVDVPIVVITARDCVDTLQEAFDAGATDYIPKPTRKIELLARVKSLMLLKREIDGRKAALAQLERANMELHRLSSSDGLTGIANRRYLDIFLDREIRRTARNGGSLSLLLIDIDHFKNYNDTYGHLAGDECLKKVATVLSDCAKRPADLAARYGGEEFVIIMGDCDGPEALKMATKIHLAIERQMISHPSSPVSEYITLSTGVVTMSSNDEIPSIALLKVADSALYDAKNNGRNTIRVGKLV